MIECEKYFEKKYEFKCSDQCIIPNMIFQSPKWYIPKLQKKKENLNGVKGKLSAYDINDWSKHTSSRDPSGKVIKKLFEAIKPELLTQAWCKFYEILCRFPVIPQQTQFDGKLSSLHLCEAPGAFICSLNHYLVLNHPNIQWKWMANTLNPNYEGNDLSQMILDDRFIKHTIENWNFGLDFTGDITEYYNHGELFTRYIIEKVCLVTADGSVDCMKNPGEQEKLVEFLHYCETITALAVLQTGGTFVLKIFTMFEDTTINLLYLLNCLFEKVVVFKPCSSKSGNSEVYVVNMNFKGFHHVSTSWPRLTSVYNCEITFSSTSMFFLEDLPNYFLTEIHNCADYFMNKQISTISNNIECFYDQLYKLNKQTIKKINNQLYKLQISIANLFITLNNLHRIPSGKQILPHVSIGSSWKAATTFFPLGPCMCLLVENLVKHKVSSDKIDIKIGKRIEVVRSSKFTDKNNLQKLFKMKLCSNRQTPSGLYEQISSYVGRTNEIINVNEFQLDIYHKFQRDFFYRVFHSLDEKKNIILIDIPFYTQFLVGLLYILFHAFEKVYFCYNSIILYKSTPESVKKVKELLSVIDSEYNINENMYDLFTRDIIQIISPSFLEETPIEHLMWRYFHTMCSKKISVHRCCD